MMEIYNPLDKKNLGESVAGAMLKGEVHPLGALTSFEGAGIYSIYYTGEFEAYRQLSIKNQLNKFEAPIYVGKAVPTGARKGNSDFSVPPGIVLYKRLKQHAESVSAAENLRLEDFFCRYLVVDDIWIPLGESLLIAMFTPVWNKLVDGFGNHDPGKGRYQGMRSKWDTLHPGRAWTEKCIPRKESSEIIATEIIAYLKTK